MKKLKGIKRIGSIVLSVAVLFSMMIGITACTSNGQSANGEPTSQVTDGQSTPQSTDGQSTPQSTDGQSTPLATDGQSTPQSTDGQSTPQATDGQSTPQATDGQSTPQASDGQSTPQASNSQSGNGELITLNVYTQTANWSGMQTGWYAALLKDKFNVQLNIIPDPEGTYETLMEAGNLGDLIVWGDNGREYKDAVNQGLLYDWEEGDLCKTYGPVIWKNAQIALETNRKISGDGAIHGLGHNLASSTKDHQSFFYTWDIRWDLYKQLGYPQVNNLDDYISVLKKMKEICPTDENGNPTYANSLWPDWDGTMVMYVKAMATAYYGYDELAAGLYDPTTGKYHDELEEGGPYLTMLKFFNNLYQNDLLDPNSMTQTYDQMADKVKAGGTFFSIFNYAGSFAYNTTQHIAQNKMMLPLVPKDASPAVYGMSLLGGNRIWSIGAYTEYPELCMEILNYLYTPEGEMTLFYGIPGLMWYYDDKGNTCFTDLGKKCNRDPQYDIGGVKWTSPETGKTYQLGGKFTDGMLQMNNTAWVIDAKNPDSNGETYNKDTWRSEVGKAKCALEQDWRDYFKCITAIDYMASGKYRLNPGTSYSSPKRSDELELIWTQVYQALRQYSWRAIYAKNDGEYNYQVQQMIKICNDYGYDKVLKWSREQAATRYRLQQAEN